MYNVHLGGTGIASSREVAPRGRWWVLAVVSLSQFLVLLDATVANVALPAIHRGLGMSVQTGAWVLDGYTLAFGGLLLAGGQAGDRWGRRRLFAIGTSLFSAASLGCGCAWSPTALIVMRCLQGAGAALLSPAALAILTLTYRGEAVRRRALTVWAALGGVGATAGVVLGGLSVDVAGWRAVFLLNVPIGAAAVIASHRVIPADRATRRTEGRGAGVDPFAIAAVTILVAAGVLALLDGAAPGRRSSQFAAAAMSGAALVALAWRRHLTGAGPLPAPLRHNRSLTTGCLGQGLLGAAQLSAMYLISIEAQQVLGLPPLAAGLGFLPMGATAVAAALSGARLVRRHGITRTWTAAAAAAAIGLAAFAVLSGQHSYLTGMLGPALAVGASLPLMSLAGTLTATSTVQDATAGLAAGILNSSFQVGAAVGVAVTAVAATVTVTTGYLAAAAFPAAAVLVALRTRTARPRS